MFDPLDEAYRWCIYCRADCWPEPEHQQHDADCPIVTGIYPVTDAERDPHGELPCCTACSGQFVLGEVYLLVDVDTGAVAPVPDTGLVVCIGCALLGRDPRMEDA